MLCDIFNFFYVQWTNMAGWFGDHADANPKLKEACPQPVLAADV